MSKTITTTELHPQEFTVQQVIDWANAQASGVEINMACLWTFGDGWLHLLIAASCGVAPETLNTLTISELVDLWERVKTVNRSFFEKGTVEPGMAANLEKLRTMFMLPSAA